MVRKFWKIHFGTKFQSKFLWAIVPVVILITLIFGLSTGLLSAYQLRQSLFDYYTDVARERAKVLVEPIWVLELERVKKLLDELVTNSDILSATVHIDQETLSSKSKNSDITSTQTIVVPITYKDSIQTEHLGEFSISFSTERVTGLLAQKLMESFVISILLSLTISFSIFRVARKQVVQPLNLMTETIRKSSEDNKRYHVPWQSECEFGEVVNNFNSMQETLDEEEEKLREANKKLDHIAYIDRLTTLPNRACCMLDMQNLFDNVNEHTEFALVHLDLDNFKHINDSQGHDAGDRLLSTVGFRLSLVVSDLKYTKAYRWGGDEFIVFFDLRDGNLEHFCAEITDILSVPLPYRSSTLWPSASVGAARYPVDGQDFASLMISADLALYQTKEKGRDGYHFFTKAMREVSAERARIEDDFPKALERGELYMAFQPQLDSHTFEVTGLEALIRWEHPKKGMISPGLFIPILEETRMAQELGRFVYDSACKAAKSWLDQGIDFGTVAINLSGQHIRMGTALSDFYDIIQRYDLETKYITAEVTENLLLDSSNSSGIDLITDMHKNGVRIELDDFGTGYAALSHLSTLPIDGLKIDRSFTQKMLSDQRKAVIIQSLFGMARLLRIGLICEGVETKEQLEKLQSLGESSIQGYYTAKPMSYEKVTEWMKNQENLKFVEEEKQDTGSTTKASA